MEKIKLSKPDRQALDDLQAYANELGAVVRISARYRTLAPDFQLMTATREPLTTGNPRDIAEGIAAHFGGHQYFKNAVETFELSDTYLYWELQAEMAAD